MFRINLHHHVGVWFHIDTNINNFINYENKLRLINFRKINPHDKLTFIYSKSLLSTTAEDNLLSFCKVYTFKPIAVENLFSEIETEADIKLYELLINELEAAKNKQGGNLAVASDIARWLKPIRARGNYSDLDVEIDTNGLPEILFIDKPFLTNYGSILENNTTSSSFICNNDVLIVGEVNPDISTDEQLCAQKLLDEVINKVVNWINNSYTSTSKHFKSILKNELLALKEQLNQSNPHEIGKNDYVAEQIFFSSSITKALLELASIKYGDNPIEIRRNLDKKHSSCYQYAFNEINTSPFGANTVFLKTYGVMPQNVLDDEKSKHKLVDFYAEQTASSEDLKALFLKKGAEKYTQYIMKRAYHTLYKELVIHTTGPKLFFSLIGCTYFPKKDTEYKVACYSLCYYGLDKNFKSKVPITLNAVTAPEAEIGHGSDLYWLPSGKKKVEKRERETAARIIQQYVRFFNGETRDFSSDKNADNISLSQHTCKI